MSFIIQNTKPQSKFKLVPVGSHLGRCYRIVDLGKQKQKNKNGDLVINREIELTWELFGNDDEGNPLTTDDGRPLVIDKQFTWSWYENANLRKMLQSWRNKPWTNEEVESFDIASVLDRWAMVTVVHRTSVNGKTYNNVDNLTPVPPMIKQAGLPKGHNEIKMFDMSEPNPDWQVYESLPRWKQEKIALSPDYRLARNPSKQPSSGFEDMDDDVPF